MPSGETSGVAVQHLDVVGRDAQPVGHDLRPRRHVALAVRRRADLQHHLPGRQALDRGRVPAAGRVPQRAQDVRRRQPAHLDVAREAHAELLGVASLAARRLIRAQVRVAGQLEGAVEALLVVARVDVQARR